jgi:cytochrome d ubiquinol oxidase subunit I
VIEGVLPTYYAASGLTIVDLAISLTIFLVLYTVLLIIGVKVMLHAVRKGPKSDGPAPGAAAADPVHAAVRA